MDFNIPRPSLLERARTDRVIRRVNRRAYGFTTRNYHRNERLKSAAFLLLMAVGVMGSTLLALG